MGQLFLGVLLCLTAKDALAAGSTKPALRCQRPEIGASVVLDLDDEQSPTSTDANYRLVRTGQDTYRVELRLEFVPGPGYDLLFEQEELQKFFERKVERCLRVAEPFLRDPSGPGRLSIALVKDRKVPLHEIGIVNNRGWSSAREFSGYIKCPTILHELLHMVGLGDEYARPPVEAKAPEYPCRPLGPNDSIMHENDLAAEKTWPQEEREFAYCACDRVEDCLSLRKLSGYKICPLGSQRKVHKMVVWEGDFFTLKTDEEFFPLLEEEGARALQYYTPLPSKNASLLYPAHFRAITAPGCAGNETFNICSFNSYQTKASNCLQALPECTNGSWVKH